MANKAAKTHKLLSVKGKQDKMPTIKPNSEDKAATTVGGPEPTWSTAQYASMKFDAILGVKPDTTIPVKVKGEKMTVVKEEEEVDDETLTDALSFETDEDEDDDKTEKVEESSDEESDDDSEDTDESEDEESEDTDESGDGEESTDVAIEDGGDEEAPVEIEDSVEVDDSAVDGEMVASGDDEDDIEITLDDLVDEDTTMIDLDGDDEELVTDAVGDLPGDDMVPMNVNSQTGIEEDDMMAAGEDELPIEEGDAVEGDGDDDEEPLDESTEEEDADKDKQEEPMAEQKKIVVKFKLDEATKLFTNSTLTEEDMRQTRSLFEAAVRTTATKIGKQLQETYQARYAEARKLHEAKIAKQVDQYLSYVVEQWVRENEGTLKTQLQNRLTENFMRGLKTLFVEHYIDVPESKVNVVEALAKNVKGLKKKLKEQESKLVKLHTESKAAVTRERQALVKEHKARLIAEAASTVTTVDRGAFTQRAQSVAFTNTKSFRKDLTALKEQYFGATKQGTERPVNAPVAAPLFEEKTGPKSTIDRYVDTVSRLAKK